MSEEDINWKARAKAAEAKLARLEGLAKSAADIMEHIDLASGGEGRFSQNRDEDTIDKMSEEATLWLRAYASEDGE